jgi:NADH-quinone oxidoreductase subunit H
VLQVGGRAIPLQVAQLNIGVLYVLVMASVGVYGVVLGGWASNNKWSLLGGLRGAAQMISYEIAMGLALVSVILFYGTVDLQEMVRAQAGGPLAWGVVYQPVALLLLLTAGIAESKRVPFDLPESESELVSGYFTEYSGVKHLMFFMTDFVEVIIVSGLVATIFFGGWQVPYLEARGFVGPGGGVMPLPHLVVTLLQVAAFTVKVLVLCWFQIVIRWTVPRFRYDQLMRLGWKGLVPLGLANVMVTAFAVVGFE